jgi:tRNA threonylcarbamoyladenosine biosynthesis protein TsaB
LSLILNIETSTTLCSVSIAKDGKIIALKEINEGYTHAENLHVFIKEVLEKAGKIPKDLNAIAVGGGPGSYTGLRIGVSAAKGLAFALQIPLIAINTLVTMAATAISQNRSDILYCPMLDARRMEIYTAIFDVNLNTVKETSPQIISEEDISFFNTGKPICFFGDGMPKCKDLLKKTPSSSFIDNIVPSADALAELAYKKLLNGQFEDVAYFEPFYLKNFIINGGNGN